MTEPVKCVECGTWWRGEEHRCPERPNSLGVVFTGPISVSTGGQLIPEPVCPICHVRHGSNYACGGTFTVRFDSPGTNSFSNIWPVGTGDALRRAGSAIPS